MLDQMVKLLNMFGSNYDGEVLNAARMVHAKLVANDWTWEQLFANGNANLTEEQLARVYGAGLRKGEALGYARGLADAQSGAAKPPSAPLDDDIDWARRVLETADQHQACLSTWEVDFVDDFLVKIKKWGRQAYISQKQFVVVQRIENVLEKHRFL
jgi:hypothetical protein